MTRHHAATTQATSHTAGAIHLDGLRLEISDALDKLNQFLRLTRDLLDTTQSTDRLGAGSSGKRGRSPSPRAPGNLATINLEATITAMLHHNIRQLTRDITRHQGSTAVEQIPTEPNLDQLVWHLRGLIHTTQTPSLLHPVLRDIRHATEQAEVLVDATPAGDCPWCHRPTLTWWWTPDEIECHRDRNTGQIHPCTCTAAICPDDCAHGGRHRWHRRAILQLANLKTTTTRAATD